jgi:hypothetical protein
MCAPVGTAFCIAVYLLLCTAHQAATFAAEAEGVHQGRLFQASQQLQDQADQLARSSDGAEVVQVGSCLNLPVRQS